MLGKLSGSVTGHSSGLKRSSFGTVHGSGISEMAQGMSGPNGQRSSQFSEAFFQVRCFLLMAKERRKEIVVFPKIGVPQNGWFMMENPIKMDDLGIPLSLETPKSWCFLTIKRLWCISFWCYLVRRSILPGQLKGLREFVNLLGYQPTYIHTYSP